MMYIEAGIPEELKYQFTIHHAQAVMDKERTFIIKGAASNLGTIIA